MVEQNQLTRRRIHRSNFRAERCDPGKRQLPSSRLRQQS
jgi:hypothetical protein